jgi:glc operon protein GlcG
MRAFFESVAISHELALHLIQTAIAEGRAAGVAVAVAVVDPAMALVAYARADGVTPHSADTSRHKAQSGASTRRSTGWMQGELAIALPLGTSGILTNIRGGFPIVLDGKHLGGLGVAGGPPDVDAQIALAALIAIGAEAPS